MDHVISRYRNITALVLIVGAQFLLLAYQVKSRKELTPVRAWAITGFMPVARILDFARYNTIGMVERYAGLVVAQSENTRLKTERDNLKLENQFLKNELATADRGRALAMFQAASPHKLLAARVVGTSTVPGSRVLFVDRGSQDGVKKGMAVITPDGIVGRITSAQPSGSQLMLLTDVNFAAGVISEKRRILGIVKGQGHASVLVDYVQNEDRVEAGEIFYTSGDDWIFPKGLPVGQVKLARRGRGLFKEVFVEPLGLQRGLENVLIMIEGVHQSVPPEFPEVNDPAEPVSRLAPPASAGEPSRSAPGGSRQLPIDADQVLNKYQRIGEAQRHRLGAGPVPDFTVSPPPPPQTGTTPGGKPAP
jgi:rod shape-determining protein MreC